MATEGKTEIIRVSLVRKFYVESDVDSVILLQGTSQSGTTREDGEESRTSQGTESQKLAQKTRMLQHLSSLACTYQSRLLRRPLLPFGYQ